MKIIWFLILSSLACKWLFKRWPWDFLALPGKGKEQAQARALLGVSKLADHAQIIEAHRRLIAVVHPDRGGSNEQVHEANAARDLLLSEIANRRVE